MKPLKIRHYTGVYKFDSKKEAEDNPLKLDEFTKVMFLFIWNMFLNNVYFWGLLTMFAIYGFFDIPTFSNFMAAVIAVCITYVVGTLGKRLKTRGRLNLPAVRPIQKKLYRSVGLDSLSRSASTLAYYRIARVLEELGHYTLISRSNDKAHVDIMNRVYEVVAIQPFQVLLKFDKRAQFQVGYVLILVSSDLEKYEKLTDAINIALTHAGYPDLNVSDIKRVEGNSVVRYEIKDDSQSEAYNFVKGVA
ncbi:hypothetical protein [Staphylococcus capitis]|uniref:hypothetical protein n=1 Tax=Staphylococcus capitis TaxID=29388 RepID=UPI003CF2D5E7